MFNYFCYTLTADGRHLYNVKSLTENQLLDKAAQELNPSQFHGARSNHERFTMILAKWNRGNGARALSQGRQDGPVYLYGPLP